MGKVTINTTVEMPIPFGIGLANMLNIRDIRRRNR